jgi:lipopolysaccharide transport system ATP-binding protein
MGDQHLAQQASAHVTKDSNSQPIISLNAVGKAYKLYQKPIDRLKDTLLWRLGRTYGREFWALRSISVDIQRGDSLGIVGRNGSGKSTLLQIIAGVLQPTEGQLSVDGRVSALLELGSGFNPEYTGRENVLMSGALLGFSREEMVSRFDDIVAFADIGEFIEQPVKNYSSGMFARLAFSAAISVDPEILIVDEILAVGDYGFQQKCLGKMRQMLDNGLTLLFVSHNPDFVKSICTKGLFLQDGAISYWGSAEIATDTYLRSVREAQQQDYLKNKADLPPPIPLTGGVSGRMRYGRGYAQIERLEITDDERRPRESFKLNETIHLYIHFSAKIDIDNLSVGFAIRDQSGISVIGTISLDEKFDIPPLRAGESGCIHYQFKNQLPPGNFGVSVLVNQVSQEDYTDVVILDQITAAGNFLVVRDPNRPVWYKYYCPVEIEFIQEQTE